jgi:hypothetical protein
VSFVPAKFINALQYAFFESYAQMVRTGSEGAFGNRKLSRHLTVMLDFRVSFVQMVIEDEFLFVTGQKSQTF